MKELDLLPNYLALYVAIVRGLTAEKAFIAIGYHGMFSDDPNRPQEDKYTIEQVQRMVDLRKTGLTYKEIGMEMNAPRSTVAFHIKRYLQQEADVR